MVLYYLTLLTDAILIIIQRRAALLAFTVNDLLATHPTLSAVSLDSHISSLSLFEEIVKIVKLKRKLVLSTDTAPVP